MTDLPTPDTDSPADENEHIRLLLAHFHQTEQARLEHAKAKLRAEIFPRLKQWGVAKVKAEYSGFGDSGCIDHIAYLDSQDQPVNMDMVRAASDPEIKRALSEFLPVGFENNEGGQGDVTIDVQTATVTIEHQENYTATRDDKATPLL